ncbi:MAG: hypothetical protein BWZ02_03096 [Lentisphaerae bacterium ADurb.BinA184]|nr:MAG: hypothetical protein BWZ02_03096 [Lentisphaerae bacterium ADurb.BinA184]
MDRRMAGLVAECPARLPFAAARATVRANLEPYEP